MFRYFFTIILSYCYLGAIYHPDLLLLEKRLPLKNPKLILENLRLQVASKNRLAEFLWPDALIQVTGTAGEAFQLKGGAGRAIYTFEQLIPFPGKIIVNGQHWQAAYELAQGHYKLKKTEVEYWYWQILLEIAYLDFSGKIIAEQITYVDQLMAEAQSKVATGSPISILLAWQMEKVKLENALNELKADVSIKLIQFKAIFGRTDDYQVNDESSRKKNQQLVEDLPINMQKILLEWQWPKRSLLKLDPNPIWKGSFEQLTARQKVNVVKYKKQLTIWDLFPDLSLGLIYGDNSGFRSQRDVRYGLKWNLPLAVFNKSFEIQVHKATVRMREEEYYRLEIETLVSIQSTLIAINKNITSQKMYDQNLKQMALQQLKEMEAMFITGGEDTFLLAFKELLAIDLAILKYRVHVEKEILKLKLLGGLSWEEYDALLD